MNPSISAITLGVRDIDRGKEFYQHALGFDVQQQDEGFVAFAVDQTASTVALYTVDSLAADAGVSPDGGGFRGVALSFIVGTSDDVDAVLAGVRPAGGTVVKAARSQLWGGYTAYIADPDGHLWKIASNHRPPRFRSRRQVAPLTSPPTPTETALTLGCRDIKQSKAFYSDGLGFCVDKSFGKFASFKPEGKTTMLSLYTWDALADDAGVDPDGHGFRASVVSYLVASPEHVDEVIRAAAGAGASTTAPTRAPWGGYSGHFTDPSGHLWKVASRQ